MNAANALDALEFETAMDLLSDGDNVYAVPVKDGLYYKDQEFPCQLTAHGDGMEFGGMQTTYICSEEDLLASGYALVLFEDSKCGKEFLAQKKADRELAERRANSTPSKSSDGYGSGWGSDEGFWHG